MSAPTINLVLEARARAVRKACGDGKSIGWIYVRHSR
jgi:hypothetical protein